MHVGVGVQAEGGEKGKKSRTLMVVAVAVQRDEDLDMRHRKGSKFECSRQEPATSRELVNGKGKCSNVNELSSFKKSTSDDAGRIHLPRASRVLTS